MGLRKRINIPRLLNRKPSRPITSLQILKPIDRNTRSTRSKLQQSRLLLRIPSPNNLPEVLDDFVLLLVAAVVGMLLPVFNVDVGNTAN